MSRAVATCNCGIVLLLACVAAAQLQTALHSFPAGIEDVVIPASTKGVALTVKYESRGEVTTKNSGIEITQDTAAAEPDVFFKDAEKNRFYTLFMVDPDAPDGQGAAANVNYLHWLVTNIPGTKLGTNPKGSMVNTIMEYEGPTPPAGTHRYVFMLYEQPAFDNAPVPVIKRADFDFAAYAAAAGMRGPVGAVYFVASA